MKTKNPAWAGLLRETWRMRCAQLPGSGRPRPARARSHPGGHAGAGGDLGGAILWHDRVSSHVDGRTASVRRNTFQRL